MNNMISFYVMLSLHLSGQLRGPVRPLAAAAAQPAQAPRGLNL